MRISLFLSLLFFATLSQATLLGRWEFEDSPQGSAVNDSSAFNNDGTIYGASWTSGARGNALWFGGDDYVDLANSSLNISNQMTLGAWLYFDTLQGVQFAVWKTNQFGIVLNHNYVGGPGTLSFSFYNGDWRTVSLSTSILQTNTWYYVAGTYDGSQLKIYLDGVQKNSFSYSGTISSSTWNLWMGNYHYSSRENSYFKGRIDDVSLYNTALSNSEIQGLAAIPELATFMFFLMGLLLFPFLRRRYTIACGVNSCLNS